MNERAEAREMVVIVDVMLCIQNHLASRMCVHGESVS